MSIICSVCIPDTTSRQSRHPNSLKQQSGSATPATEPQAGAWGWKLNQWARLHDGNHAYLLYGNLLKNGTMDNLWDTHPIPD